MLCESVVRVLSPLASKSCGGSQSLYDRIHQQCAIVTIVLDFFAAVVAPKPKKFKTAFERIYNSRL